METQLATNPADQITALNINVAKLAGHLQFNLGMDQFSDINLPRITVPAGGGTQWTITTAEGETQTPTVDGVIVHIQDRRAYFRLPYGQESQQRPDCASQDGITGVGNPGGECASCPLNKWDSGPDGRGKACAQMKNLFLLRGESILPEILVLPPTSLKACLHYMLRLSSADLDYNQAVTRITLARVKNANGIAYSEARFQQIATLSEKQVEVANQFHGFAQGLIASRQEQAQIAAPVADAQPANDAREASTVSDSDIPF